jgi:hypothetical protein
MAGTPILPGKSFSSQKTNQIADRFFRDGFVHIPKVLTVGEVSAIRAKADEFLDDLDLQAHINPTLADPKYVEVKKDKATGQEIPFILRNGIGLDQIFRDMLVREPILGLAESIVGKDSKFCGQNVIRNLPGLAIDMWHVDDQEAYFPIPDGMDRHDSRIRMPVMWFTVQVALSDIDLIEHGPTQYVPGSHYSGRLPKNEEYPEFDGKGPVSIFCKAGDIYLQDPMCWHRGAPNTSDRTRYLFQSQYAANWAYVRFNRYNRVPVEDRALSNASDTLLNLLGAPFPKKI